MLSLQSRLVEYGDCENPFEGMLARQPEVDAAKPAAKDGQRATLYDAAADRRSWTAMKNFLEEKLTQ